MLCGASLFTLCISQSKETTDLPSLILLNSKHFIIHRMSLVLLPGTYKSVNVECRTFLNSSGRREGFSLDAPHVTSRPTRGRDRLTKETNVNGIWDSSSSQSNPQSFFTVPTYKIYRIVLLFVIKHSPLFHAHGPPCMYIYFWGFQSLHLYSYLFSSHPISYTLSSRCKKTAKKHALKLPQFLLEILQPPLRIE